MAFEAKKFQEVFDDMRQRTFVLTDFEVGSVTRTMYESFAYEIALLYEKMRLVYLSAYVDTAEGQQLDMVVSILGITRGQPDFAEGEVTFERDRGNEDISIPLGTLVATEETAESPKKVYQTFEPKVLLKDQTVVNVKARAVIHGEEQVTPAETIKVMPRPVPGIKTVINQKKIDFLGKRRETDDELRERAKNALISSGKASIVSIENTLLTLSKVKDVKVKEHFHYAVGEVVFERNLDSGEIMIPRTTRLTVTAEGGEKSFETTEEKKLPEGENSIKVPVQSIQEGKSGEITSTIGVTWSIATPGLETLTVSSDGPILLGDFGIIEVFVDGIDFNEPAEVQRIRDEIDRVRAAGIFVLLKPTVTVSVDGVFKIEINSDLKLSNEERAEFEETVKDEIHKFLLELKMGQPFLFSRLIKNILSIDGVENLEDFKISTFKGEKNVSTGIDYDFKDKRIDIAESEKFNPRYICVASETKMLPVHIQFQTTTIDAAKKDDILNTLGGYFGSLNIGDDVQKSEIQSRIETITPIVADSLKLMPKPWCDKVPYEGEDIAVSFAEQAKVGEVFAFHSFLEITGALKLTLPSTMTGADKKSIQDKIKTEIETYLDNLKPEADVVFDDLLAIALAVDRVLAAVLDRNDFRVTLDGEEVSGRITEDKIEVQEFEKARLMNFCITGDIETVRIEVTTLTLELRPPESSPEGYDENTVKAAIKLAVKNTINNFLSDAVPGDDLIYINLKSGIENLVPGTNYTITQLSFTATSLCDNRIQETNIETTRDIHVRSVEIPVIRKITENDVVVTVSASGGGGG